MLSHFNLVLFCKLMDCSPLGSSVHGDFPGKNPGVVCHHLLQGIFLTQGSNPHVMHWQVGFFVCLFVLTTRATWEAL